jgi:two-component system, NtrC family, response regulator HupR/HoxA
MEQFKLNSEVWKKVFSASLFQQTRKLFKQIFKRNITIGDFESMGMTKPEWESLRGPAEERSFPFCDIILAGDKRKLCVNLEKQIYSKIATTHKTDICRCYAGMTEIAIPIIVQGKYCGCVSTAGGLLLNEPNENEWKEISEKLIGTGIDLVKLKKAYQGITPISKELFEVMIKLLNVIVEEIVKTAVEAEDYEERIAGLEKALYEKYQISNIVGQSKKMFEVYKFLDKAVETNYPVVIQGETGTGKELVAKALHFNGSRKEKPFISESCAAFAPGILESELFGHVKGAFTGADKSKKGLFELAGEGTLFLDEIGVMDHEMQKKILRVLQEYEIRPVGGKNTVKVNVRLIVATNQDLKKLVEKGVFREDLYYRLNVITINLPPLRERSDDIPLLVDYFLGKIAQETKTKKKEMSEEAIKLFSDYHWPGNVRELENEIKRICTFHTDMHVITSQMFAPHIGVTIKENMFFQSDKPFRDKLADYEKELIIDALNKTGNNKTKCSVLLGLDPRVLRRKLKRLGLRH